MKTFLMGAITMLALCQGILGLAIAFDHATISAERMQVVSAPQAQLMPASLPNPYLEGR